MNISTPLSRIWYWIRWYYLVLASKFFNAEPYLRYESRKYLKDATPAVQISRNWDFGSRTVAISVAVLVLLSGAIFIFGLDIQWASVSDRVRNQLTSYMRVLWQVQAGLLSVGFVVIVLLMQVLGGRDQLSGYVFEEYVRHSGILTVAFLGLSSLAVMGATAFSVAYTSQSTTASVPVVVFNSVLLGINLLAVGVLYSRIVRFVKPGHGISLTAKLLKRNLQRNLQKLILEAFAKNVLVEAIKNTGIDYSPTLPRQGNPVEVEYPVGGDPVRVRDIDLAKLKDVSESLSRERPTGPKGWIRAKIGTTLSVSNPHVGYLESGATESDIERFTDCFLLEEVTDQKAGWEASVENLKTRANRAVTELQPSELSDLLDVYVDTLRHYSTYVRKYDSEALSLAFDDPLAMSEYWRPDKKLYRDFRDLARQAVKEDDINLVREVLYPPVRVMRFAQAQNNPDLFQQFAGAYVQFYNEGYSLPANSDARRFTIDRSWRHLRDYARRMSFRYLERPDRAHDIIENAPYAHLILKVFNRLMKRALDLRDEDSFLTFLGKFNAVFDDLPQTRMQLQTELLGIEQKTSGSSSSEAKNTGPNEVPEALRMLEKAEQTAENVSTTKSLIRFGISAWILDLYQRDQIDRSRMKELITEPAKQYDDLEEIYQAYVNALDAAWNDKFRWDIWNDQRHNGGDGIGFGAVTTKNWLRRFYVVKGLQLVQPGATESHLSPSPELKTELGKLRDACEGVIEDGHPIQDFDNLEERKKTFIRLHEEALRRQEERETDQLVEAELDAERVELFKEAFLEHWETNSLERLLTPFGAVDFGTPEEKGVAVPVLTNPLERKKPFTGKTPEQRPARIGKHSGTGLARAERNQFVCALKTKMPVKTVPESQFAAHFESFLEERDFEMDLLLVSHQLFAPDLFPDDEFVPEWRENGPAPDFPGYAGRFGETPVCQISSDTKHVVAVDVDVLTVHRVVQGEGKKPRIEVEEITEQRSGELLEESPSRQAENESEVEAMRRLRQHVVIKTDSQLHFDIEDGAGVVVAIEENNDKEKNMG